MALLVWPGLGSTALERSTLIHTAAQNCFLAESVVFTAAESWSIFPPLIYKSTHGSWVSHL